MAAAREILGRAFKNLGVARVDVVIATKALGSMGQAPNRQGGSRRHLLSECRASTRRLGVDYIDLYQLHGFDPLTPIEETLEALDTLVRAAARVGGGWLDRLEPAPSESSS